MRNRASGTWVIHLARKIAGPNGEFRGLVSGALELKYFEEFFGDIALAPGGTIEVFRHDTTLLVRHPKVEALIGKRFPAATALKLVAAAEHGVGRDMTERRGADRRRASGRRLSDRRQRQQDRGGDARRLAAHRELSGRRSPG